MEEKIRLLIPILEKLHRNLLELVNVESDKRDILLRVYKPEELLPLISQQELLSRKFETTGKEIESFFKESEIPGCCNITSLINRIADNNELHTTISNIQKKIKTELSKYTEIRNLNDSILRTEATFYNFLLNRITKTTTYNNKNNGRRLNTFNTVA